MVDLDNFSKIDTIQESKISFDDDENIFNRLETEKLYILPKYLGYYLDIEKYLINKNILLNILSNKISDPINKKNIYNVLKYNNQLLGISEYEKNKLLDKFFSEYKIVENNIVLDSISNEDILISVEDEGEDESRGDNIKDIENIEEDIENIEDISFNPLLLEEEKIEINDLIDIDNIPNQEQNLKSNFNINNIESTIFKIENEFNSPKNKIINDKYIGDINNKSEFSYSNKNSNYESGNLLDKYDTEEIENKKKDFRIGSKNFNIEQFENILFGFDDIKKKKFIVEYSKSINKPILLDDLNILTEEDITKWYNKIIEIKNKSDTFDLSFFIIKFTIFSIEKFLVNILNVKELDGISHTINKKIVDTDLYKSKQFVDSKISCPDWPFLDLFIFFLKGFVNKSFNIDLLQ